MDLGKHLFAILVSLVVSVCCAVVVYLLTVFLFIWTTPNQQKEEFPPGIAIAALTGVAAAVAGFVFTHRKLA